MKNIVLAMVMLMSITTQAQEKWTLRQCLEYAMQNNITLRQDKLQELSATEDRKQSQAALLPSLSASTNHTVGYRPWQDAGIATVSNGTVSTKVRKTYYNGTYGINTSWTVWNGNKNHNQVKLNKLYEQQAHLNTLQSANTIQEKIAQLYVQVLYTNDAIAVTRQSLAASKKNEERGEQMVEVGSMSKAELAQLTAQRATDEYNLVDAETKLAGYKLQLKQLLEITGDQPFDVATPTASDEQALQDIPALSSVYEQALLTRPEIKNAQIDLQASDLQIKIARSGHMPTISMTGGVGTSTTTNNSNEWGRQIKTNFDASAGVGVSVPIFDQRKTRTALNKSIIEREKAMLAIEQQRKTLYQKIETFWLDALTNQQKFRSAQVSVESAQQSYDLLSEQFQLGLKNIVELMNGKTNLLKAQQNMLQSKYVTILAQQMLQFYQGSEIMM